MEGRRKEVEKDMCMWLVYSVQSLERTVSDDTIVIVLVVIGMVEVRKDMDGVSTTVLYEEKEGATMPVV